ncbi:hypothetical protein CDAR_457961 [Caerostris darwini]|uniref:Uncharacterized protein n=1 Tax=Caerostris darwini TaxID=1538125 RepID=A0AAV4PXV9_9ARAC|nr:hypothetical protein CDAR_457961 [Caerostris darwini]
MEKWQQQQLLSFLNPPITFPFSLLQLHKTSSSGVTYHRMSWGHSPSPGKELNPTPGNKTSSSGVIYLEAKGHSPSPGKELNPSNRHTSQFVPPFMECQWDYEFTKRPH